MDHDEDPGVSGECDELATEPHIEAGFNHTSLAKGQITRVD